MKRALLVAIVALSARADPVRTDPTSEITVYTDADGAHVVTLVGPLWTGNVGKVMNQREYGHAALKNIAHAVLGVGLKSYWVRTRFVDGRLICEKFAHRPNDSAEADAWAKELFAKSCS